MATTKYIVTSNGTEIGVKNKKAQAVELATTYRNDNGVAVQVATENGKVVFEVSAKRTIKMSPKFTRTVALPEGVTAPEGLRVAYVRGRTGLAVVCDDALRAQQKEEGKDSEVKPYALLNLKTGKVSKGHFRTTRDAGKAMTEKLAAVKAAAASTPEPANA